ncbi:MAG: hypothetical protein M3384_05575 [Acidobacteriota bacterium]|nr:hypothetical protein [Acidobacteriota bacterium]
MEEIQTENTPVGEKPPETATAAAAAAARQSWSEWLGTDEAVRWVYLVFGFCAIFMVMIVLQRETEAVCCGDWDGYYHIRWSSLLWESFKSGGWLPEFKWLPLTVLNPQDYNDHHFLFHLLQIPFLWVFEPVTAAKVATVFYAGLAIFSVYWLLFYYRVNYLLVWLAALLTCANPFFYRMNMAKAPPLTIIITIIGIYLLFERKYVWLLPLMFLFVWTYSLFPLLFIAAVIWAAIIGWNERKLEWKPLAYTGGGMLLGNIINPYFPSNLTLFWEHLVTKVKVGSDFVVAVGGEWYPYSGQDLLTHFPIALGAMLLGYILFMPRNGKLPERATFFLVFVTVLLASQFRSKRFAEYFPPFAILFAAFSWQAFLAPNVLQLPEEFKKDIEPYLDKKKSEREEHYDKIKNGIAALLCTLLFILMIFNFRGAHIDWWGFKFDHRGVMEDIRENEPHDKYRRAAEWMMANIPEDEIIFNCNWDDFPKLFFFDTKHRYVYGLDPNYLYSQNPELSKLIGDITGAKIDDPGPVIREKFGARYVFSDAKENTDFLAKALDSGWFEMAYEDDEAYILKIRDEKGEPPDASKIDDENGGGDSENGANDESTEEELRQLEEEENAAKAVNAANRNAAEEEEK